MKAKKTYKQLKEHARNIAMDWLQIASEQNMSYAELNEAGDYFQKIGKRFGLLREFRENAIPC